MDVGWWLIGTRYYFVKGTQRMRAEAEETMILVRKTMGLAFRSKQAAISIPVNHQ